MKPELPLRILVFGIALASPTADAIDPNLRISQYAHTAWRTQEGSFRGTPNAFAQTTDGYLWIGTTAGLVRFDGMRFVPWTPPDGKALPSPDVTALFGAADGSLWIGTRQGLVHWKDRDLVDYSGTPGGISFIVQDHNGAVWTTRYRFQDAKGPLCRVENNNLRCFGAADGIPFDYATSLAEDNLGNLWIGSYALCRWKSGESSIFFRKELKQSEGLVGVEAVAAGRDGSVWVGLQGSGTRLGLQHYGQEVWKSYSVEGLNGSSLQVSTLLVDRDNSLWIGTINEGIYRVHDGKADHFRSTDGLSGDSVDTFYQDREGNLWVATKNGIDSFRDFRVTSFSTREGLTADSAGSVLSARNGTLWIGNEGALESLRQGEFSAIRTHRGLPGQTVTSLLEDHAGRLWVGVDNRLTVYTNGVFHPIDKPDGSPVEIVTGITEDVDHDIWAVVVTRPGRHLVRIRNMKVREELVPPQFPEPYSLAADPRGGIWLGLSNGDLARYRSGQLERISVTRNGKPAPVRDLYPDPDGSIWATTNDQVMRWNEGQLKTLGPRNGLGCGSIYALAKDKSGSLWLYTAGGVVVISEKELERWWNQTDTTVKLLILDDLDGAQPPGLTYFRPTATRTADGRLWFVNGSRVQMIDPGHLSDDNSVTPQVHVEQLIADRKNYLPQGNIRLPARTRDIEIDYTAPSFVAPQKVEFRYKLEGYDHDWQDPKTRRQAFYTNLRPGNYRFRVMVGNNAGVWNEAGAALDFGITPTFYQTSWFVALCLVTAAATFYLIFQMRLRQLAGQVRDRMESRLAERERIARDLHDTLLQSVQGLILKFHAATKRIPDGEPARENLEKALDYADQVLAEGRTRVRNLRASIVGFGELPKAFQRVVEEAAPDRASTFKTVVEGSVLELHPIIREETYSIGREALINALTHSEARNIEVEIIYDSHEFRLRIRDDGRGIDPDILEKGGRADHWGLQGMRERAARVGGQLSVWSRPESGTEVELKIPAAMAYRTTRGKPDPRPRASAAR